MPWHWILLGVGFLFDLIGSIWALQGFGLLPGSFMTGQRFWAGAGLVSMVVGMGLVVLAIRLRRERI
jgi:hypothetical protein